MPADRADRADRADLLTEQRLPASTRLDALSASEIVALMNDQDRRAVEAVAAVAADVARAAELVADRLSRGGRLVYFGAGTSGRLGVLDASECPPTFRSDARQVRGVIAGGPQAMFAAKEGAEDSPDGGAAAVDSLELGENDVAFGIAAGGTTPFVVGAMRRARERDAATVFLACVAAGPGQAVADLEIRPLTGPEVLTGSTRLKAGTATKLVLNQVTTAAMVRLGKCYENLMVDLRASNAKLRDRGARIVSAVCGTDAAASRLALDRAGGHVKLACVMAKLNLDAAVAARRLDAAGGRLRDALTSRP